MAFRAVVALVVVVFAAGCGSAGSVTVTASVTEVETVTVEVASTEPAVPPVYVLQGSTVAFRPAGIGFGANGIIRAVEWDSYGGASARGSGELSQNSCVPSCAEGAVTWVPVRFTLEAMVPCRGIVAYSVVVFEDGDAIDLGECVTG